jgi:ABC-type lipoprotein release transport system permease subunit
MDVGASQAGIRIDYTGGNETRPSNAYVTYHFDARDPGTLALVALALMTTAVMAGSLPARRAAKLDPVAVLRAQ